MYTLNMYSLMYYNKFSINVLKTINSVYYRKPKCIYTKFTVCLIPKRRYYGLQKKYFLPSAHNFKDQPCAQQNCNFRTTQSLYIPPVIALLLRPLVKVGSFVLGRSIKKWWRRKSEEERKMYKEWLKSRRNTFIGCLAILSLMFFLYYVTHIETDPLTQRSRFIIFTKEQEAVLDKIFLKMHLDMHKDHIIPANHPIYKRLLKVVERLLIGNKDLAAMKEKDWTLTVIDSPLKNAYVLSGGNIFVFSGIMNITENDDQLGIVLAHEMAHALLRHSIETFSRDFLFDIVIAIPLVLLWAIFPDVIAIIIQMLSKGFFSITHTLPYTRALETEADDVGLKLAANACIDVREAVVFWGIMRILSEMNVEENPVPSWLSTHPAHEEREKKLNEMMPHAIDLRKEVGCPVLRSMDPRTKFYQRSISDHEMYFKQRGII